MENIYSREWTCTDSACGSVGVMIGWSYEDMAERGNPVCKECGADLVLVAE